MKKFWFIGALLLVATACSDDGDDANATDNTSPNNVVVNNDNVTPNGTPNNTANNTVNNTANNTVNNTANNTVNNTGDDMCSTMDPGSDLMWVYLSDDVGNVVAWGTAFFDDIGADANACTSLDHLDGTEPFTGAADGQCPEFGSDSVVAMGGGTITFGFFDDTNTSIDLTDDLTVVVGEFGTQCPTGTENDSYEVYLCTEPFGPEVGDNSSCTELLGEGSGEAAFDLTFATGIELWIEVVDTSI